MANIILTSYCNLHCPYCFANSMITTENTKNISLEQFNKVLNWLDDDDRIGLIGGEPTLHPQFDSILTMIESYSRQRNYDCGFILFTNGIYLNKYLNHIPRNMDILINVNQPQAMTPQQYADMIKNISIIYNRGWFHNEDRKATLGCNICQEIDDYSFIWTLVKRFKIPALRMSVCAPTREDQLADKEGYYNMMKPKFLQFVQDAKQAGTLLSPDCNQIPPCYFTQEEIDFINSCYVPEERVDYPKCAPVIDISIDFTAAGCFGCYERVNCEDFANVHEVYRYFMYKGLYPKILNNCTGKCVGCKKFELMQCQGGCLAFGKNA